jgi:hypothetical protein
MAHQFDGATLFCTRCGCALTEAYEGRKCSPVNVIALSHILARRRLSALIPARLQNLVD